MKKINDFICKYDIVILKIFLILQPFIDLITSIEKNVLKVSFSIGMIIRSLFILYCIYYLFISKFKYKKRLIYYILIVIIYILIYLIFNCSLNNIFLELSYLIRNFYFLLILPTIIIMYNNPKNRINSKIYFIIYLIYGILILLAIISKTSYSSYSENIGYIGWFNSANEVSAIMSILLIFSFDYVLNLKNKLIKIISLLFICLTVFIVGTKTPVITLTLIILLYYIKYIINLIKNKNNKKLIFMFIILLIIIICFCFFLPYTPIYKSIELRLQFFNFNLSDIFFNIEAIDKVIYSSRISFFKKINFIYSNSPKLNQYIGIGYTNILNNTHKVIEMDYYDIFFCYGKIGFAIYYFPLIYMLFNCKIKFVKLYKYIFVGILILLLAVFSGHVFTSPSVSIYATLIFVYLYYDYKIVR